VNDTDSEKTEDARARGEIAWHRQQIADLEKAYNLGGTNLTREDLKKMTPDEVNRRWPEVQDALAGRKTGPLSEDELRDLDKLPPDRINRNWEQVRAELQRRGAARKGESE
jgi:hypothetical protein